MNKDYTDITMVVDRSGSMAVVHSDAEGGINSFINDQKKLPGKATLTLVQFDNQYDFVHTAVPIKDVPPYELHPRGGTALLDAVGRAVTETGERLKAMPESDRPGLVVFVIITDGQENASKEFTLDKVREKIKEQQDVYKWQFTFLGAHSDAFAAGAGMGIPTSGVARFANSGKGHGAAYAAASANVGRMRGASGSGQSVNNSYTGAELEAMANPDQQPSDQKVS